MYMLDTDMCIFALRHHPIVKRRLGGCSPVDVAVASMTEAELYFGALRSRDPERSRSDVLAFLVPLKRAPFDTSCAELHAAYRQALIAQPIGERDLVIGSTAQAHGATLVTHNVREFSRIPGLVVEDWSLG
jgi:tRNA(fMet)-specific endonuclease VapC